MRVRKIVFFVILVGFIVGGCSKTVYRSPGIPSEGGSPFSREVWFKLSQSFYQDFPECLVIFPTAGQQDANLSEALEYALARYLAVKFPRVLTSKERQVVERELSVSVGFKAGRQLFSQSSRCWHAAQVNLLGVDDSFLGVWAQKRIIIEAKIYRVLDGRELWRSKHAVSRSDGGLPLSPLSIGLGLYKAAAHKGDHDIMMSMIDDALRRMTVTIPTVR